MNKIVICVLILLVLLVAPVNAYYIGFGDYGLDHSKAERVLAKIPSWFFDGLTNIVFSNSTYTSHYHEEGDGACYQFWFSGRNRITIGSYASLSDDDLLGLLLHELGHHDELMNTDFNMFFGVLSEDYADSFAYASGLVS